ncbi:MAG: hypothetical protein LUG18_08610 [Candidatus Azobacteroides sp.]|nr:hypothetical protein [Candidatus Azobacteroides sp.]
MNMKLNAFLLLSLWMPFAVSAALFSYPKNSSASISLKVPGNPAIIYPLTAEPTGENGHSLVSTENIPVHISREVTENNGKIQVTTTITALEDIYFNYAQEIRTGFPHHDCQFYMPGFWYRRNLRSPKEAPSFHTSDSWTVREDRLSVPLTGIFNEKTGDYMTVTRIDNFKYDALTTHKEGEVIVSGTTSIGYTGFKNKNNTATLSFGFPYHETPETYIRKLTLAPEVKAFQSLKKGESIQLTWEITENNGKDFSDFVKQVWVYSYDLYKPQVVSTPYTPEIMKRVLSNFFTESFVDTHSLKYMSAVHMRTDDCKSTGIAEVGFIGRALLNAFNAMEYGTQENRPELIEKSRLVFDSYLQNGFTSSGFFREVVDFDKGDEERNLSIRRQSEGLYAVLYYLQYEKKQGRKHPEWEAKVKSMLEEILKLQKEDGSFPRKFRDDLSVVNNSAGSTPSATPMLVLASRYFNDNRYLKAAKKTAVYLEKEIISKADYFSSTLDANCEDKEASFYATTALYHLSLFTTGNKEKEHYSNLAKQSAYFCLSWYYMWDVPFAPGQMLGEVGLKTRGWGNVSVENNHIDVYIFDFATILDWLAEKYNEPRFSGFSEVIRTSMTQLLPYEGHLCDIAKTGYYPEVVQHTNWDYGKNGKGFYNDVFAPGWTVASLWEMFTPERIKLFEGKK